MGNHYQNVVYFAFDLSYFGIGFGFGLVELAHGVVDVVNSDAVEVP